MFKSLRSCSLCGKQIQRGQFIGVLGNFPKGMFKAKVFVPFVNVWETVMDNPKIYCESCFNKKFKKVK